MKIPMLLTWLRIVLIPVMLLLYYLPETWLTTSTRDVLATLTFMVAAVTDWFDGWLARRWNQTSPFGAFLDPVADKLMVCAALLILLDLDRIHPAVAFIIIGREITISALREWMATLGSPTSVAVHWLGKLKTTMQMVAIPLLLFDHKMFDAFDMHLIGTACVYIAVLLTVWSMCYYLHKALPIIQKK